MQDNKIYYMYCIKNIINSKIYVGVHSTSDINDDYFGSGIALRKAINKYGSNNFEKTIIKFFGSSDEMFKAESEIVNENFIKSSLTYNMKLGGYGGWVLRSGYNHSASTIEKMRKSGKGENNGFYGKKHSEEALLKISESSKTRVRTESQKQKMRERHSGENNPMYGITPHNALKTVYNGVEYPSIASAAKAAGMNVSTFKRRYL
ncbi:homing endonuclease [Citrobacter phage Moon]|uniref:Homing endonuclease n=2 Tax=Moonvirus TaxID=1985329 RepID=A0A2H4YGC2_9CAUD|nr:homing endonuclease [Citrobacter phage Moon]YP_009618231.1 homing endonuclease [Citrobacter phage CF1 ERZ-2017]AIX12141.1 homing endonuclease [Citrobacter phage Moon]AUE23045.1 homing endonuclease [Citrobacter phage CF1 ERZ-2017]